MSALDALTVEIGAAAWAALGNGTALVALTALLLWLLRRRLPAGAQALLWTAALVKFVIPCGPSLSASLSQGLQLAGRPIAFDARDALVACESAAVVILKTVLVALYAAIVVVLALRAIRRYRRLLARARSLPPAGVDTRRRVAARAAQLGVRPPDVRRSDEPVSPHLVGVLRPILIVPDWLAAAGDAEEAFLVHELAHLRRRDHWLLPAIAAIEILFFFWPPLRYAASRLRGAREAACDATAVTVGPLSPTAYARSLVHAARNVAARPAACRLVLSGAVTCRLEERVDFLLHPPDRRVARFWLAAAVAVWTTWALAGAQPPPPRRCSSLGART